MGYHDFGSEFKSRCRRSGTCSGQGWDFWAFLHFHSTKTLHFLTPFYHFHIIRISLSSLLKPPAGRHLMRTMDLAGCKQVYISSSSIQSWVFGLIILNLGPRGRANCSGTGSCRNLGPRGELIRSGSHRDAIMVFWQYVLMELISIDYWLGGPWHCRDTFPPSYHHLTRIQYILERYQCNRVVPNHLVLPHTTIVSKSDLFVPNSSYFLFSDSLDMIISCIVMVAILTL